MHTPRCTKFSILGLAMLFAVLPSQSLAQEVAFSDYVQPPRDFLAAKVNSDNSWTYNYYCSTWGLASSIPVQGYSGNAQGFRSWPPEGDPVDDASRGLVIGNLSTPGNRLASAYDIQFMYKSTAGAPTKFRIDLMRYVGGESFADLGTAANGGIIDLTSTNWTRFRCRRLNSVNGKVAADRIRIVALQDESHGFPHAGTYNPSAVVAFDNIDVTIARKLTGFYKVSGTTSKDLGAFKLSSDGTGVASFTNWIQNLGNVDIVNVYGANDFSGGATVVKNSSNLMFTYVEGSARQFVREQLNENLTALDNSTWMGSGALGDASSDKFYGYVGSPTSPRNSAVVRQIFTLLLPTYTHTIRIPNGSGTFASEAALNLGGEQIVAIADVNCDGADDFITRGLLNYNVRYFQNYSGSWPNTTLTLSAPQSISSNSFLSCVSVADMNGDGFEDLLLRDLVSGDVFSLICSPSGGSLTWLFRLDALKREKIYALADADNDGIPDIYSTRRRILDGAGEITVRKVSPSGTGIASFDLVAEFDYDRYTPCAIGDINGDGSADVVTVKTTDTYNDVITYLVDPVSRHILGKDPHWICYATTANVRPIFDHLSN